LKPKLGVGAMVKYKYSDEFGIVLEVVRDYINDLYARKMYWFTSARAGGSIIVQDNLGFLQNDCEILLDSDDGFE
jgi:hypothetical protein